MKIFFVRYTGKNGGGNIAKSLKIISAEAKDLYGAMQLVNNDGEGYSIRKPSGELSLAKFKNTLDWSLDTKKLEEEYSKATRRRNFSFTRNGKKYTTAVINVTFSYSYKEFNQFGSNTYIRNGYTYRDCDFTDGAFVVDGELIGIQTGVAIEEPLPTEVLGNYFVYEKGQYCQRGSIPVLMNKSDLRRYLYENGFVCDGTKYVRYKRSSGSSRVGKCLFVVDAVAKRMEKWDRCGIEIKDGDPIDLAAYEAYISLPMSSIIDTLVIPKESILIVDDAVSEFEDTVVAVEEADGNLVAEEKKMKISNTIWDGESLLDYSLFGQYSDKGMLLLRNRFFKTCAFNTNIAKWFSDNGITEVSQLNGFTLASDISQIKLITTPSSIKYLKFGTIETWLENIDETFGIVKFEKETHFFNGEMVQCHYQLINTIDFTEDEIREFLKDSLDYISLVRQDPDILRYHIGYAFKSEEEEEEINPYKTKNDVVFKLLGINNRFAKTKLYKDFRDSIVRGFMKNLKRGHILVNGNYSTLFGNGIELLKQAIGKFDGESSISPECIHSTRFGYGQKVLGTRSPHICAGNVLLVTNVSSREIDEYFNLTNEIVYINSIQSNIFQKLNGADLDSDTMLLTDNEFLIRVAERREGEFKVPTNFVQAQKRKRYYDDENKTDLDIKTSVNKIGEIVNLSQYLNSIYWERSHRGGSSKEELRELYLDICKLAVLSNIEIDKAKKEFTVDSGKEIEKLKQKYRIVEKGKPIKPVFFKTITLENGYKLTGNISYRYFDTPMDYYQKFINSFNFRMSRGSKDDLIPFMDIVKPFTDTSKSGYYTRLRDRIIEALMEARKAISQAYIGYDQLDKDSREDVKATALELKQKYMQIVDELSENEYMMGLVLRELDNPAYRSLHSIMFEVLFGKPNETFIRMINRTKEPMPRIIEEKDGEITMFQRRYTKDFSQKLTTF